MRSDSLKTRHVLIIGGGIGGLCLAQGLKKSGISVAVYERDGSAHFRDQGYRISIKEVGSQALRDCLPENLFHLCIATAIKTATQLVFLDEELNLKFIKPLLHSPTPDEEGFGVNRLTLREILLADLDDIVHFGKRCEGFDQIENGQVRAHFADGTSATGDLLVGADGANSLIRAVLAPDARIDNLHSIIYGKTPIQSDTMQWIPEILIDGFVRVVSSKGTSMGVATCRQMESATSALAKFAPKLHLTEMPDYFSWTLSLTEPFQDIDGAMLHQQARKLVNQWHPALQKLIDEADIIATSQISINVAQPVKAWNTPNVTLLGDAIHSMSPSRGEGASIALRDAQILRHTLVDMASNGITLTQTKAAYEKEMRSYGFEAVSNSLHKSYFTDRKPDREPR